MKCQICFTKILYKGRGRPPKYCEHCAYLTKLLQVRMYKYNKQRKIEFHKHNLGTTNFFEHPANDLGVEYRRIQLEMKRLGIKRQFT